MGIQQVDSLSHWNYFLTLEEDIHHLSRWIEPAERNFNCYSLEIARLLMTTAAEVDVMAKLVCKKLDPSSHASSINAYQDELKRKYPTLNKASVSIPRFGLTLKPWTSWRKKKTPPLWWQDNNKVKHHRSEHFDRATLKNLLNAVAALLILEVLYYQDHINALRSRNKLFISNAFIQPIGENLIFFGNLIR